MLEGEVEAEGARAEVEGADGLVAVAQWGVGPDQGGDGCREQEDAAHGLGAQRVREVVPLGQGQPAEEDGTAVLGRGHGGGPPGSASTDYTCGHVWCVPTRLPGAPLILVAFLRDLYSP
ncbi:hypothetical protein GCM10020000_37570 [Streptomyces olivoverticillatus]